MIFTSSDFPLFLAATLAGYFLLIRWRRAGNALLLAASYIFYSWVDWRLSFLLLASSLLDYVVSLLMRGAREDQRHKLMITSVVANLSILGFFKYANFFAGSFHDIGTAIGFDLDPVTLNIILPVGISFYTFQSMSYTIDVYRRQIPACESLIDYLLYVSFFPQLVAGPIERAGNLLGQIQKQRPVTLSGLAEGAQLMVLGYFKKVVLADNIAVPVDRYFAAPENYTNLETFGAAWLFAFQIYFDFSAYTDIARGVAKLMGFDLIINFRQPYLSRSIAEFWTRWHISLSSFFRDYVYIPLGGSRVAEPRLALNIIIVFALSGLWHGAQWTFVLWGLWHGLGYLVERGAKAAYTSHDPTGMPGALIGWTVTLAFVVIGWLFFRAESFSDLATMFTAFFDASKWRLSGVPIISQYLILYAATAAWLGIEALTARSDRPVSFTGLPPLARQSAVLATILAVFWLGNAEQVAFIYFQF